MTTGGSGSAFETTEFETDAMPGFSSSSGFFSLGSTTSGLGTIS